MKKIFFEAISVVVLLGTFLTACSPTTEKMLPVPDFSKPSVKESMGELMSPPVDILFVIDNSGSMDYHQTNLSSNIKFFIDGLATQFIDYNIGVVTSDDARLRGAVKVVRSDTPRLEDHIRDNLMAGTYGSAYEVFLDIIEKALSPALLANENKDFYRPKALLATVILTDAEDQGTILPKQMYDKLIAMKGGDPNLLTAYSVVIPPGENRCARDEYSTPDRIIEYTKLANGLVLNLCDSDYGKKLVKIVEDIGYKTDLYIQLLKVPVVGTISVTFGSQKIPNDLDKGWTYSPSRNAILLGHNLQLKKEPKGTGIVVNFTPADI